MGESEELRTAIGPAGSLGSGRNGIGDANVMVDEVCLTDGGYDGANCGDEPVDNLMSALRL